VDDVCSSIIPVADTGAAAGVVAAVVVVVW